MFKKRFSVLMCFVLIAVLFLTGCSGGEKESTSTDEGGGGSEEVAVKDSIIFGIPGEPPTLDPHMSSDNIASGCVCNQIFDFLITLVHEDGSFEPCLAESWEIVDDDDAKITTVVLKIREGVKFHNGEDLTVDDVVFSLNRAAESKFMQETTSALDYAEAVDDHTVVAKFKYYYGPCESVLADIFIVNKALVEADEEEYGRKPIGTGAYEFVESRAGDKIILTRYDDYFKGPAAIKDLQLKIIVDPTTASLALEKGDIDLLSQPSMDDRHRLMESDKIQYDEVEVLGNTFVTFNNTTGLFSDQKLRQAVAHAVDKESMLIGAAEGAGVVAINAIPRQCFGFSEEVTGYEYDTDKAKALLAEAGYPDGFPIELKTMDSAVYSKPTEVLQDQLRDIGIIADISKMERGAYLADVYENAEYEITIMSWVYRLTDADCIYALFHGEGGENFFRVNNPRLSELLDKGRAETDATVRAEIYKEAAQLINDESMMIPLYAYLVGVAADKNLKGVTANELARYNAFEYSW